MTVAALTCLLSGNNYPYKIHAGLSFPRILALHEQWGAEKVKIIKEILQSHPGIEGNSELFIEQIRLNRLDDLNWNWTNKALVCNSDDYKWFFLEADGKIQAACIIYFPKISRLDGEPIFYVDYVATAYWNRGRPGHSKKFGHVCRKLIAYASSYGSEELGYRAGFCLHSIPTAESYYRNLGLSEYDHDEDKENLRYYEAPQDVAKKLAGEVQL